MILIIIYFCLEVLQEKLVNHLYPNISMYFSTPSPYIFYCDDEENLLNNQDLCYLLITSFFLTTFMFD